MRSRPAAAPGRASALGPLFPPLRALILLQAACAPFTTAAASDIGEPGERVWAAAAFVLPGDSTPLAQTAALTPLGARRLFDQGAAFRARYLSNASAPSHIVGIEPSYVDATQLTVAAGSDDAYSAAGALAFLQGLYPPVGGGNSDDDEPSSARLANGSVVDSPLGGYQYLSVATSSSSDEAYIWLDGRSKCNAYSDLQQSLKKNASIVDIYDENLSFYTSLWEPVFDPVFTRDETSFYNAYNLWDYAKYRWTHDNATRELMTQADLDKLATLAADQQWYANADLTSNSANDDKVVLSISGRTLASRAIQGLDDSISQGGSKGKLILNFVPSTAPLVAFFALAGLDTALSEDFSPTAMPSPGAAVVFELFSPASVTGDTYPSRDDLRVRFVYRNDTASDALQAYPVFGSSGGGASGMRWDDFAGAMQNAGVADAGAWCRTCRVGTEGFCAQYMFRGASGSPHNFQRDGEGPLSATTGGIIGAAVMLGALGLLAMLSALYRGGKRRWRENHRGGEKLADDGDEAIALGGLQHQRPGSLELQNGERAPGGNEEGVLTVPRSIYGSLKRARTRAGAIFSSGSRRTIQGRAVGGGKGPDQDGSGKGVDSDAAHEGQRPTTPREMWI